MLKKIILICFLVSSNNIFAQSSIDDAIQKYNSGSISYISVEQLQADLVNNEKLVLLDARSKKEYEVSHLKDAIWIGYNNFEKEKVSDIDKVSEIIIYCSVGVRSEKIGEKLLGLGYKNIKNLYGGIFSWVNNGYPIYNEQNQTQNIHGFDKQWGKYLKAGKKVY